jgi:isopenicillin N synthase-like dioxygenase
VKLPGTPVVLLYGVVMPSPLALPVIDFSLLDGSAEQRQQLLQQLRGAARDHGFFYLVGHGIAADKVTALRQAARAFFALPEADKLAIDMENSPHFRGYTRAGEERTRGAADWREQLDIGAERPRRPDLAAQGRGGVCKAPINGRQPCRNSSRCCWTGSRKPPGFPSACCVPLPKPCSSRSTFSTMPL